MTLREYNAHGCWLSGTRYGVFTPNWYVNALSGKASSVDRVSTATQSDLEAVKAALRTFASVLILEAVDYSPRIVVIAGCAGNTSLENVRVTNNDVPLPADMAAQENDAAFRALWEHQNALDISLYKWANATFM